MDIFADVLNEHHDLLLNAVVRAASELGLFEGFRGTASAESLSRSEVASGLGLPSRRLNRLLDILVAEGILSSEPPGRTGQLRLSAQPSSDSRSAGFWDQIADVMTADQPLDLDPAWLEGHLTYVAEKSEHAAPPLWKAIEPGAGSRLLDLGGGLGAFSLAFLRHNPANSATLEDLPEVVGLLQKRPSVPNAPLTMVAGDALETHSRGEYDIVLLANVLHLFGGKDCRTILENAVSAVAPGGKVIVWDLAMSPDRTGPLVSLYFALNMAIFTEAGDVHPPGELMAWMSEVGLEDIIELAVPECRHSLGLVGACRKA